ncbi:MAG: glycosyltransferase family 4 protein [Putridiphycobacter sp.]|nr:glycosyltransferase family 4 protein [Putridiphycobacter sp.]
MDKKPIIFVILSRVPLPLDKGDKLRAYHQIKALAKENEVHLTCLADRRLSATEKTDLAALAHKVTVYRLQKWVQYWQLFLAIFSTKPFQVHYFYQRKIATSISKQIDQLEPDYIYCQLIRVSEYVKDIHHIPKTIDYMDALSVGMMRQASINSGVKRYVMKLEGERLKRYENRIFDYFNHHTIISEQDKQLISHTANYSIKVVPNGIDDSFLSYNKPVEKVYDLVFVGNLNYAPNVDSCMFIIDELLPALQKTKPDVRILLAGTNPNDKIIEKAKYRPNITISGWVDDIRACYLSSEICIAPLFIGTGLQNKLLESMALGVPCITTSLANNALKAKPNSEILIANTLQDYEQLISKLLKDKELYQTISQNGKSFVKSHFNWESSVASIPF